MTENIAENEIKPNLPLPKPTVKRKTSLIDLQARIPLVFRVLAVLAMAATLIYVGIGFYRARNNKDFSMISRLPQLSTEVTAVVIGYERRVTEGERTILYLKADKDTTFADGHHELENVYLENYPPNGEPPDKITAGKAIYIPEKDNPEFFKIYFQSGVKAFARNGLNIETEEIAFDRTTEIIETPAFIKFNRENINGTATGANANIKEKTLELLSGVDINILATDKKEALVKFGENSDVNIKANRALFNKDLEKLDLTGSVNITSTPKAATDKEFPANLRAEKASFEQNSEIAEASGNVEIYLKSPKNPSKIYAQKAVFKQKQEQIELYENVTINTENDKKPIRLTGGKAVYNQKQEIFELAENVTIDTENDKKPIRATGSKAVFNRKTEDFSLNENAVITVTSDNANILSENSGNAPNAPNAQTIIRAQNANYEKQKGLVTLTGGATVERNADLFKGNKINANLNSANKLSKVTANGEGFLRSVTPERTTEVFGDSMIFDFDARQELSNAKIDKNVRVKSVNQAQEVNLSNTNSLNLVFKPNGAKNFLEKLTTAGSSDVLINATPPESYSSVKINTSNGFQVNFAVQDGASVVRETLTNGRTSVFVAAPNANADSSDKKITADNLKLNWNAGGKDLQKAEAVGNAELIVEPKQKTGIAEKKTLTAARIDCGFFESGNDAQIALATGNAKTILEPYQPTETRGTRTLTANKMSANFVRGTQEVERFDATGNTKFNERDRNGIAANLAYTASDETVRLRGGEPTVWDNNARLKAGEIDWDTRNETSQLRGKVATTYYSQKQTNGATPFTKVNSPVFLTANQADLNHKTEIAIYTGNARAWQENNYVRAEKLILNQPNKTLIGDTKVQSALYNTKRKENGLEKTIPAFAQSDKIFYSDKDKFLRYEGNVDIRQGTDRITSGIADIFLSENNDVTKTVAQKNVVITQPNRKATGDWAQYTASDEVIILRGNPAFVEDTEQGRSTGAEVTVFMRENRVVGQGGKTPSSPGRVRGTLKVKKQ